MKKTPRKSETAADMLPEYDFTSGVRGKYAAEFADGVRVEIVPADDADVKNKEADPQ